MLISEKTPPLPLGPLTAIGLPPIPSGVDRSSAGN
jgi:hypothetical protein